MKLYYLDEGDQVERLKLRAPDAIQLILTIFLFTGSLLLMLRYTNCNWNWQLWVEFTFYGNMVWLAYLLITLVGKFKSRRLRRQLQILDYLWFLFHIVMWVWLCVVLWKNDFLNKCSQPVDMFGIVYFVLGALGLLMAIVAIVGAIFGLVRPKENVHTDLGSGVYHDPAYDDDLDFNPYN